MTTRLGNDDYKRGKQTLQEKLTKEEIDEKLLGYVEIKDLELLKTIKFKFLTSKPSLCG